MNETKLSKAMKLAAKWHARQVDKSGVPYVAHLMGVWERVREESEDVQCVALLHDILEDTEVPTADVMKFGEVIFKAVCALTHLKGEPYKNYIANLKHNPIARIVKLADLEDNTSEFRLEHLNAGDKEYFGNRAKTHYYPAMKELTSD